MICGRCNPSLHLATILSNILFFTSPSTAADITYSGSDPNNFFIFPGRYGSDDDAEALVLKLGEPQNFTWVTNYTKPLNILLQQLDDPDGTDSSQLLKGDFIGTSLPWDGKTQADLNLSRVFSVNIRIPDADDILFTSRRMNLTGSPPSSSSSSSTSQSSTFSATSTSSTPSPALTGMAQSTTPTGAPPRPSVSVGGGVGIGIGAVAALAIIAASVAFLYKRRKHRVQDDGVGKEPMGNTYTSEKGPGEGNESWARKKPSRELRGELDAPYVQEIDGATRGELDGRDVEERQVHELEDRVR